MSNYNLMMQVMTSVSRLGSAMNVKVHAELSNGEYIALHGIREYCRNCCPQGVYVSELARMQDISPAAVSKKLQALEKRDLICREIDPNSRRNTFVRLTPHGEEVLARADIETVSYMQHLLQHIDNDKLQELLATLNGIIDIIENDIRADQPEQAARS
ncbi:MAG: winged helix-turn-helix transcriptional regulator [Firmicutes bacterium]|nr:winged helix-turn-helix transcriptional regulator [Bacillota bacterium]